VADKNTVQITFKVNSDGTLQQIGNAAKKTAKSMDQATESTVKYNRHARGVANLQQNQTKAFAATARGTSGLVATYATLMAHVFALTAAFGALQRASALEQLEKGLVAVGNAGGQNLPYVAREIQAITGHAVTLQEAMEGTALAMSAGFGIDQLKELTKVARGASIALGRNMGDALTRLVKGTAKLEPEILDELGIMVRLDKASQDYAASLGKTVTQLTRFEKQQAFLNATIDQGQKKFSVVLDSIDPDPYSKLSAAFLDLTKEITTLINKGLIPVINFLSSSKFAMTGAIILFASSITKMLIPALGDMASTNRAMAASQAADATKASRVVSTQYLAAVKKVNAAFKTVPPSVKAVEAQFRAGTLTVAQYKSALTQLMKSERLRDVRNKADGANASATKKRELAEIRELIAETQRLIALEGQRTMLSGRGQLAKTSSKLSKRQSIYQDKMNDPNTSIKGAFAIAGKGAKNHFKDVGKAAGRMNKLKLGIEATTKSVGLFGSALLRFVPIIGWAFTAFSLLSPLLGDVFKKGAVAKAAEEVTDSFKSFADISAQLTVELEKTDTLLERTSKQLAVRVGILDQVAAGLSKVLEAEKEEEAANTEKALQKVMSARRGLNRVLEAGVYSSNVVKAQTMALTRAEEEYAAQIELTKSVSREQAQQILAEAQATIEATGLTSVFGNELSKLDELKQNLGKGGPVTAEAFLADVAEITKPAQALKAAQNEATEASIKLDNQLKSNTEKSKGMYGELFTNVSSLKNALVAVKKGIEDTDTIGLQVVPPSEQKQILRLAKAMGVVIKTNKVANSVAKSGFITTTDYLGTLEEVEKRIAKNNVLAAEAVEKARGLNAITKELGTLSKANAAAKRLQLEIQQESNQVTLAGLNAELENKLAQEGQNSQSKEVLQIKQKILNVQKEIGKVTDHEQLILQSSLQHDKAKNDLLLKQVGLRQKIADNVANQAKRELELARKRVGKKLSAKDETKLLVDAEKTNAALRASKLALEKKKINIEYDLMNSQFDLEKIRIARIVREEALLKGQNLQSQLDSGDFDALFFDKEAIQQQINDLTSGTGTYVTSQIQKLTAPINDMQRLIEGTPAGSDAATGAATQGTEGLRQTALNAADSDSTAQGDKATHDIAMKDAEAEQERFNRRISGHNDVAKAGMQAERDIENATALRAQREAEIEKAVKDGTMTKAEGEQAAYDVKADALNSYASSVNATFSQIGDTMAALGPEGAVMGATLSGVGAMSESFTHAFTVIKDESASMSDKMQAGLGAIGTAISAIGGMQKAASEARVKALDSEIAAEKKRDGKSAASTAKIRALEKKKELEQRKAFEQEKKMKIGQAIISTMQGAIAAYTAMAVIPIVGPALGAVAAGMVLQMGKQQVSAIKATTYQGGSISGGPTSLSMGERSNNVDLAAGGSQSGELAYMRGASGTGNANNFTPAFNGYKHRAAGGSAGYIVGEQGPELFVPETPGEIMSAGDTAKMGAPTNVNFSISAVDATGVEELLTVQRGNIIRMIRDAANQQGESFLEGVAESEL